MKSLLPVTAIILICMGCIDPEPAEPEIYLPKSYLIHKTTSDITIDGNMDEAVWHKAPWTSFFLDIEGTSKEAPYFDTRVKMLWDEQYLYFFTEMQEEHIWGDITERDAVIFYNNDFEIFIKPDPGQPHYVEFEVNALGTLWDLILLKPYRIGGPVSNFWDVNETQIGIQFNGSLNDPTDIDTSWTVEIAIPLKPIAELRRGSQVQDGTQWQINFSRVQWQHSLTDGSYARKKDANNEKYLPESNWVWTPQYAIDMHRPEHWGVLQFSSSPPGPDSTIIESVFAWERQLLFHLHRKQLNFKRENGAFAKQIEDLGGPFFLVNKQSYNVELKTNPEGYLFTIKDPAKGTITLDNHEFLSIKTDE